MKTLIVKTILSASVLANTVPTTLQINQPLIKSITPADSPQGAVLVWRYKIENNTLYKRLFNESRNEWVGEWIKCA